MKKMAGFSLALVLLITMLTTQVSAGVYFSQPDDTYNIGDMINMTAEINPLESSPIKIDMVCDRKSTLVFYNSMPESVVTFNLPLISMHISNLTGECYFIANYHARDYESRVFKISKKLDVNLLTEFIFSNPGEEIVIEGSSTRMSGVPVNGEVKITIPLLNLKSSDNGSGNESSNNSSNKTKVYEAEGVLLGKVTDGSFSVRVNLDSNMPAGDYRIDVLVYENSLGERASEGLAMGNLKVFQVLRKVDIALNDQNIDPGNELSFKPLLIDQSEKEIEEDVSVIIRDDDSKNIFERVVNSKESINYPIPSNMSSGYYTIEVGSGESKAVKQFYINEKAIVSFKLINESVFIENIGNIPYNKDVQIEMNGRPFVKSLNLGLGEAEEFRLTGDGSYDVRVSDGERELVQNSVPLTGRAVGVNSAREKGNLALSTPVVWIFLIIVLGAGLLFLFRNILKKKSFAFPVSRKSGRSDVREIKVTDIKPKPGLGPPVGTLNVRGKAEQVLVLNGQRSRASVIALKIKNKIGKVEKQSLEKAIEPVYDRKGAVYEQGDYIFIVFTPLMTKNPKSEVDAARAGENISLSLKEYNKKFKDKIEFGIGIHSGDIINKIEDKKLKFTSLGNFISAAKRLADSSEGQVFLSKGAYEKGIAEIKAEKKKVGDGEAYEVRNVINHEKNQEFIGKFLERMKKEEKK